MKKKWIKEKKSFQKNWKMKIIKPKNKKTKIKKAKQEIKKNKRFNVSSRPP